MVIGEPLSDLITIEVANIWGKLFLSRRLFSTKITLFWVVKPQGKQYLFEGTFISRSGIPNVGEL